MDFKDLMVGDLVYVVRGYDKHLTIEKIKGVIEDEDKPYPVTIFTGETVSLNDIKPIPPTEEILVKNGFRYTANVIGRHNCKCYELEQKGVYHMTISIYKNKITCELDKVDALYMNVVTNYVHELQHLLRLVGVQKEIEL